jgi:MSHA biogenesis protein MshJ
MANEASESLMLRQRVTKLLQRIDALSLRERLFVFAAILLVIGGAWEAFLAAPLEAREAIASAKVESMRQRIGQLDESIDVAAHGIGEGMTGHLDRIRVLQQQVTSADESVRIFTSDLVDPAQMRFVLEDLIRRQAGLKLVSVNNLAGRPLIETESDDANAAASRGPKLYRHGLVLVLEGSYLDCLTYLENVERLPWQLYWGSLVLETEQYPQSRITIELHTLSLEEDWIGV